MSSNDAALIERRPTRSAKRRTEARGEVREDHQDRDRRRQCDPSQLDLREGLTDQPGLHGWGEATLEWKTRAVTGAIEDLAPFVVGQDPMRVEHIANMMTRFSFWPLGSIGLTAASGIEQALWDIKGKALGVPVWQLLGGKVRDKVRIYTHLMRGAVGFQVREHRHPRLLRRGPQKTVEMGYDAVKLGFVPYNGYDAPLQACAMSRSSRRPSGSAWARMSTSWSTSTVAPTRSTRDRLRKRDRADQAAVLRGSDPAG